MSQEVAKRSRGRPKGSKNKSRIISGATVEDYCKLHKYNPTEFLIRVARGESLPYFDPKPDDIMRANTKLHDSIHHNKPVAAMPGGELIDGQFTLVFEESNEPFALPGETDAERASEAVREEQI